MKTALKYGFGAIVAFILVSNATGAGNLITSASNGGTKLIKQLQGK